jgi:hypothetical protein
MLNRIVETFGRELSMLDDILNQNKLKALTCTILPSPNPRALMLFEFCKAGAAALMEASARAHAVEISPGQAFMATRCRPDSQNPGIAQW